MYYELRPDMDTRFRGVAFVTNSAGLADREYSLEKPPKTFRAVVMGSSLSMPSGVEIEHAWHSVVEDALNEASTTRRFEFINFGVEHYGLGEIVATLKSKAMDYDPDLIILALSRYTPHVLWDDDRPAFEVPPRMYRFFEFTALHQLSRMYGLGLYRAKEDRRQRVEGVDGYLRQVGRALLEMNEVAGANGISFAVVWVGFAPPDSATQRLIGGLARKHGFAVVNARKPLADSQFSKLELQVDAGDSHPNALAHGLMAEEIKAQLSSKALVPVD